VLDQRFFTSEFQTWDLWSSQGVGTLWATVSLFAFITYEEVERRLIYCGPRGVRSQIFPNKGSNRSVRQQMNEVAKSSITRRRSNSSVGSIGSQDSAYSLSQPPTGTTSNALQPPILVYHESARSIVFRDHLRRAADVEKSANGVAAEDSSQEPPPQNNDLQTKSDHEQFEEDFSMELSAMNALFGGNEEAGSFMGERISIQGFTPNIVPLPLLELGPNDEFLPLFDSNDRSLWTPAEVEVVNLLDSQRALVKTIKNNDWTDFLHRFKTPQPPKGRYPDDHNDIPADGDFTFNSFMTSTSLLPAGAKKMRCYGAAAVYTSGIVFAMPKFQDADEEKTAVERTRTVSGQQIRCIIV